MTNSILKILSAYFNNNDKNKIFNDKNLKQKKEEKTNQTNLQCQ